MTYYNLNRPELKSLVCVNERIERERERERKRDKEECIIIWVLSYAMGYCKTDKNIFSALAVYGTIIFLIWIIQRHPMLWGKITKAKPIQTNFKTINCKQREYRHDWYFTAFNEYLSSPIKLDYRKV